MRLVIAALLTIILSSTAIAQVAPPPQGPPPNTQIPRPGPAGMPMAFDPDWPTRVFIIRYVDIRSISNLLSAFGVPVSIENTLKAVSVRAPQATLTSIEDLIKRFDVPANASKNVEISGHLVLGSLQADADSVPASLKPVIDQLKNVMAYKSYRVVDTIVARGKEGDYIRSNGMIARLADSDPAGPPIYEDFVVRPRVVGEGADQVIHLQELNLVVKVFSNGSYSSLSISTSLDVKRGQQVVVGKATVQDRALILVLSAKVVD